MPGTSEIVVKPLRGVADDRIVFESDRAGAALFEGWSDGGAWRILLPWPSEVRALPWSAAAAWKDEIAAMESDVEVSENAALDAPFLGGWAGFVTYEAMASEEGVRPRESHPPEPALFFARHRAGVVVDPEGAAFLFAPADEIETYGEPTSAAPRSPATRPHEGGPLHDSLGGGAYAQAVEHIREAIHAGDVYQVNLTRAFSLRHGGDAAELHRALTRGARPPRNSAFLRLPECAIASASPEVLLRYDRVRGVAETRPIKGTTRRSADDGRDAERLLASAKDAAEHLMIVDVARNDLGKVAPAGAVRVADYRRVRTLEYVHHLESTVEATGLRDRSLASILGALSPAASITGAPKRAAVRMIRELEPEPRGVYCGSIGFIGHRYAEMSVAIRTAVVTNDEIRFHAGGGIVWDSDAAAEDDETHAKAAAFFRYAGVGE